MHYDVVIAGGGFAGAYGARELARALGRAEGEKRVAIISERNVLVFQPMLAEVVGSSLGPMDVVNPLRQFCRGVSVLQGSVQRVDWPKRELVIDGGRFTPNHTIGFNHLALTLGSVPDLNAVPGMAEYGWPLKDVADALRLRSAIINRLEEANLIEDPAVRARLLTFVVVGGGYTGVETAGQMHDFIREAHRLYVRLRAVPPRVVLAHAGPHLLPEIGPKLGGYAQRLLAGRGVDVRLNTHVSSMSARQVFFQEGGAVETHTIVTTIGNAPNPVVVDLCRQLGIATVRGRIPTDETLRVSGQENLWAAGDGAAVPWDDRGEKKLSPPTAQFALRHGILLGRNLAGALRGTAPRPFRYRSRGQLANIGRHAAVAEVFGFQFKGFIAWWMWRTIYLAKLPGALRRLRVTIDWTFDLIFPRDISVLPRPDEVMRSVHLEPEETLLSAGDPCRAHFYVRRGLLELTAPGRAPLLLPEGSVIDQDPGADGVWAFSVRAREASDLVAFRGAAYRLLKNELKLVPRAPPAPPDTSPEKKAVS
jgi:NADH:ubiquinone reductase (H+-translocating)